jgi:hypothetical protein
MSETPLTVLVEIRDALRQLLAVSKGKPSAVVSRAVNPIATDADLDHPKYGNPDIKTPPRDWTGPFRAGQRMSESEPALLDLVAERYDYFATKNDREQAVTDKGQPKSDYDRRAAAKARGWAKRLRAGYRPRTPPPMDETPEWGDSNDPPF